MPSMEWVTSGGRATPFDGVSLARLMRCRAFALRESSNGLMSG